MSSPFFVRSARGANGLYISAFEQQRSNDTKGEPTFYGDVIENNVSIGEKLLEAGLARFVEWSAPKDKVSSSKPFSSKTKPFLSLFRWSHSVIWKKPRRRVAKDYGSMSLRLKGNNPFF